ncbi:MAG: transposase [Chromatiaceae bacterium]|nr:transposase [Chromatiaceae bacterium]
MSIARQCTLLGLSRASYYRGEPLAQDPADTLRLMRLIDEEYTRHPFYGGRKMTSWLRRQGYAVNRKRVRRLMRRMGLQSVAPKPCTSRPAPAHPVCRGQSETGRNLTI